MPTALRISRCADSSRFNASALSCETSMPGILRVKVWRHIAITFSAGNCSNGSCITESPIPNKVQTPNPKTCGTQWTFGADLMIEIYLDSGLGLGFGNAIGVEVFFR